MEIKKDIELLKKHLKFKLWRKTPDQLDKYKKLLAELCELHKVGGCSLAVNPSISTCFYNRMMGVGFIGLNKFSVVSLLHEFAHHIGIISEPKAFKYSNDVFLGAYPSGRNTCYVDDAGYVRKKTEGGN